MTERTVAASAFKAQCLALLDQVAESKVSLIITKRGRVVARVVPAHDNDRKPLEGSVTFLTERDEDLFSTGEAWDMPGPDL
jgi:prevent-host-death family protein